MNQVGAINPTANKIPVKYVVLNPFDIVSKRATTFNVGAYEKVLSEYELSRLQNPSTEEDQLVYDALDPEQPPFSPMYSAQIRSSRTFL
ncbi:MAG: hypothetical protein P8Q54_13190 [Akkermansiaceae bacterium]|nr:hypothetical protein [Akkermansiaceae bacterium]